jgi:RNA polymerase sigma factor (sigma-70 family)
MSTASLGSVSRLVRTLVRQRTQASAGDADLLDQFHTRRDETAFTTLVQRHGPMVLGVCRRILRNDADAEDAFQGTFLLLAVRAGRIRKPSSLASWLHGVARRLAARARARARRRAETERRAAAERATPAGATAWRDLEEALDDTLAGLPPRYRVPLVLCYLQGNTQEEVARLLGRPLGTVRSCLARGRVLLRARLVRRGVALSSGAVAAALLAGAAEAVPVSGALMRATATAAAGLASGRALDEVARASVAALVRGAGRAAVFARVGVATLLILVLGAATTATGLFLSQGPGSRGADEGRAQADPPPARQPRLDQHGDPLPPEAVARLGTSRFRSGDFLSWLVFTPDGKTLLAHGGKGDVTLWDVATGRETGRISGGPAAPIHAAALSADGNRVVTVEGPDSQMVGDRTLRLWDRATGKPVRELGKGPYASVSLSPDGTRLAAVRHDGRIDLWDVPAGRLLRGWKAHDHVTVIAWRPDDHLAWTARFTPDGKVLVTGHPLEGIRFWDVATGDRLREWSSRPQPGDALALSPNGGVVAVGSRPAGQPAQVTERDFGRIHLLDLDTGKELRELSAAGEPPFGASMGIRSVAFSANGKRLAARGADGFLRVWDAASGRELRRWWNPLTLPFALALSADGQTLAAPAGGAIRLLDVASGKEVSPPLENSPMLMTVGFSPDGRTGITLGRSAPLLWDTSTGRLRQRLDGHQEQSFVTGFAVAGNTLYSWGDDRRLIAWDLGTGQDLRRLAAPEDGMIPGGFTPLPDGKALAVLVQGKVLFLDAASGREVRRLALPFPGAFGLAFPPDGRTLVVWCSDGSARVCDLETGRERRQIAFGDGDAPRPAVVAPPGRRTARFYLGRVSPDGRLAAFGSDNLVLAVHELASGRQVRRVDNLPDGVGALAFAPDGRTLAWAGTSDPTVRLVEVATGAERQRLPGHRGRVWALAFSPDGRRLLSGSQDATALVWDLTGSTDGKPAPLGSDEREACWADLASPNAARAYRAVRRLAASPASLGDRLRPVGPVDVKRVARLIGELDGDDFGRRTQATAELEALGEGAVGACRRALEGNPSPEMRRRLEALLDKEAQAAWDPSPEQLRRVRLLEALELSGTAPARHLLEQYAGGLAGARLTEEARAGLGRLAARPVAPADTP